MQRLREGACGLVAFAIPFVVVSSVLARIGDVTALVVYLSIAAAGLALWVFGRGIRRAVGVGLALGCVAMFLYVAARYE